MDSTFWWNFAVSIIIGVLQGSVKNENSKKKLRASALKIRDLINVIWPEEEFTIARAAKAKKTLNESA